MKTLLKTLSLFLLISLISSCVNKKTTPTDPKTPTDPTTVLDDSDLIDSTTFKAYRANWRNGYVQRINADSLSYFNVPNNDLQHMLNEHGLESTRVFLGMEGDTVHLMFVGIENGVLNYEVIADYATSCPPVCNN